MMYLFYILNAQTNLQQVMSCEAQLAVYSYLSPSYTS